MGAQTEIPFGSYHIDSYIDHDYNVFQNFHFTLCVRKVKKYWERGTRNTFYFFKQKSRFKTFTVKLSFFFSII